MMMLVLTVCSFEGTWNIDRNEKQCESTVFFVKQFEFIMKNKKKLKEIVGYVMKHREELLEKWKKYCVR